MAENYLKPAAIRAIWHVALFVVFFNVATLCAIRFLIGDYQLIENPQFFPSIVGRPEFTNVVEPRDRALALLIICQPIIVLCAVALARSRWAISGRGIRSIQVALLGGSSIAIYSLTGWRDTRPLYTSWPGFETGRVSTALILVATAVALGISRPRFASALRTWLALVGTLLMVCFVGYFLQFGSSIRDLHSRYIVDELLAPATGSIPLVNYTSQYTQLLGLPLAPFAKLLPEDSITLVAVYVSLLQIACLALVFVLFRRLSDSIWAIGGLLIVVIVTLTSSVGGSLSTTVAGYWAVMPMRLVGPVSLIVAATFLAHLSPTRSFGLGCGGAMVALNNIEWGLPALLGLLLAITLSSESLQTGLRHVARALSGVVVATLMVAIVLNQWGQLEPLRLVEFAQIFGGKGFFAVPSLTWGIHLIVFATHVTCLLIGIVSSPLLARDKSGQMLASTMICTGVIGLGSLLYFVSRSLTVVLVSTFMFWGISVVLLLIVTCSWISQGSLASGMLMATPVLLLVALTLSVFQMPQPLTEIERLRGQMQGMDLARERNLTARLTEIEEELKRSDLPRRRIGLIGADASWLSLQTGTKNLTNYNDLDSIVTFSQARRLCNAVTQSGVELIIVTETPAAAEVVDVLDTCSRIVRNQPLSVRVPMS